MKTTLKAKWKFNCAIACLMEGSLSFLKKILLIGWLLVAVIGAQAATYYVSPTGNDTNNGTSWSLAKRTIQAGINVATSGDTILVADGTYLLTSQISISPGITVRSVNGAQSTILNGNGVTPCALLHPNAVLDGFIVTNGYSSSFYGGIYAYGGTVQNCTISGNFGDWVGGVYVANGIVQNCTISGNTAYNWGDGGGVFAWNSTVQNCTISGNSAAYGGGVEAYYTTVENCTIRSNSALWDGGGVYIGEGTVENCFISGNAAGWGGGLNTWDVTIRNCTISSNSAYESGGGISHWGGTVQYCTINENTANWGGGVGAWEPDAIIENCLISGNTATNGGGGALVAWGGTVQNCILSGNKAIAHEHPSFNFISPSCGGGVLAIWGGIVQNCQINGNWSGDFGGGVYAFQSLVQSCTLNENAAYFDGGGACVGQGNLWNCLIGGNAANDFGGGVYSYSSTVYNCTLSGNTASNSGGIYIESGTAQNFIAYYNQNGDAGGTISNISYSCIGTDIGGVGNITNEPQFVAVGTGYGINHVLGNYRLQPTSPCINAGTNQSWMPNAIDLDGRPRILRGVVDMGAYEGSAADILIMRSPETLSNRCSYGSNAASQTIEVWNAGTNAMEYALSDDVDWLSLSPASGTSMGEVDFVSVHYGSAGLALGIYTGIVTITSAEAINPPQVVSVYLLVDKLNQTITFPAIPAQVVTSQVGLAATASSGLPVSFAVVSGPGTITAGTNLSFTAGGMVRVAASQAGDSIYKPAPNVTNMVLVERISQSINFPAIPETSFPQIELAAAASSGLPVSFAVASGPGTIYGGTNLLITAIGTVWVVASQAGNAIYYPAPDVTNTAAFVRIGQTIYVSPTGNDTNDGISWELAKQTIQGGINVATVGDTVLVANGDYLVTNQISISPGVTVRSVNGAEVTTINGGGVTRCAYLATNALLDGFTVTKGYARGSRGGGVLVVGGTVKNCVIRGNSAIYYYVNGGGGGIYVIGGLVKNCTISGNSGDWGGGVDVYYSTVEDCTISGNSARYDGGVFLYGGTLKNCTISGNWASAVGGGVNAYLGTMENCTLSGNSAYEVGGTWLLASTVRNCTISGNSAAYIGGIEVLSSMVENCTIIANWASSGSGVYIDGGTVRNCIVYYNQNDDVSGPVSYSCIGTFNTGIGNITNEPQFVSMGIGYGTNLVPGNYRLRPTSPCINAGLDQPWMAGAVDLDGLPRILHGVVDMGAYEWSGTNILIMRNPAVLVNQCGYGSNASSQTIEVWNAGTNTMAYALSANVGWLSVSPASGTSVGETDLVSVNYASAGLLPGSYTGIVTIASAEAINSPQAITVYLAVDKASQAITFSPIPVQVTTSKVGLAATASSDLPVSFIVVSGPGIISDGTNLTFTAAGLVQLVASQSGDAGYDPAPDVTNAVLVERTSQTIIFPAIPDQVATSRVGLVATAGSGLPVSFSVVSGLGIITGGTNLSFTAAGTVQVKANQAGDAIYAPAPDVLNSFSVTKAMAAVTLNNLNQTYNGTPRSVTASTVPEGLVVALTYDGSSLVPVNAGTYAVAGVVNDPIYDGLANGMLTVAKVDQVITNFIPTNGAVFATTSTVGLAAQASSGLPVTNFVVISSPGVISSLTNLTFTNSGSVSVTVDQAGDHNWNPAPVVTNSLLVERIAQTIIFPAIPDQIATSRVGLVATASSGLPVSFAVVSGPGTITGGTNLTFTAAGTVQVKASQAGDAIYYPAPNVTNLILVKQAQTITFPAIPYQTVTSRVGLVATAGSGLPVSFAVVSGPGVISGGTNLTFTAAGTVQVVASQAGDAIYNPAPDVVNSFNVTKALAAVTLHNLSQIYNGTPRNVTASTVPEGLVVELTYDVSSSAPTDAGTYAVAGVVNDSIYKGSANGILTVAKVDQAITNFVPTNEAVFATTSAVGLAAQASSGLPVTNFAVLSGPGVISGLTNLTFTNSGLVTVTVDQAGDHNWNPAPVVTNTIFVERAGQTITFPPIPIQVVTLQVGLAATASSGLPVSFAVASGPGTISGGANLSFSAVGTVHVVASQGGNSIWEAATPMTNVVIVLNPPAGVIQFTVTSKEVGEDGGSVTLSVTRTGGSFGPASVDYATADGTASAGADYTSKSGTLSWPDGDTASKTITVSITDDSIDENNETFTVTLRNAVGVGLGSPISATVTIVDNDNPPAGEIRLAQTNVVVNEDIVNVELRVARTNGNYGVVSVDYLNRPLTATAGLDYGVVTGRLTWADGDASDKVITIPVMDDSVDESNEVFEVVLTNAVGTSISGTNVATVTIVDNDNPPAGVIQFAVTSKEVGEAGGSVTLSVVRTGGSFGPASVDYATADGTASAGADYTSRSGTLSWPDGDTASKTITVSITDDSVDENDETFTIMLSNAVGAGLGSPSSATVTIVDNDESPAGEIRFAETNYIVNESVTSVVISVVRTGGCYGVVSVDYTNREVTATPGADYGVMTGRLTWADGDASDKVITIPVVDDSADEPDEVFEVVLMNAVGTSISGTNAAGVTIVDNDDPPANQADIEVSEFKWVPKVMQKLEHPSVISFVLRNDGPADIKAPDTTVEARFYLSGNMIFGDGDDILVGTKQGDVTLAAGEQMTVRYSGQPQNTDVTIPEGISGDYYVFVSVVHVLPSGLVDPDGAYAMREGPITIGKASDGEEDEEGDRAAVNDYDGDGQSDMMVYDEPSGAWAIRLSESGAWARFVFGGPGYETVPGDYDGDGKVDPAVHQRKGSQWHIMLSGMEYQPLSFDFGGEGETKGVVGDYNGDGLADPGLYEEGSGRWSVLLANTERGNTEIASVVFGGFGYAPVSGDYDGDGRMDPAVYGEETGHWYVMVSGQGYRAALVTFGGPGYEPVIGDYDGDGRVDPMLYHEATGEWVGLMSGSGYAMKRFQGGGPGYVPVPGDFDGDSQADPAIMSASGGWYFWLSDSFYTLDGPYYLVLP